MYSIAIVRIEIGTCDMPFVVKWKLRKKLPFHVDAFGLEAIGQRSEKHSKQ